LLLHVKARADVLGDISHLKVHDVFDFSEETFASSWEILFSSFLRDKAHVSKKKCLEVAQPSISKYRTCLEVAQHDHLFVGLVSTS